MNWSTLPWRLFAVLLLSLGARQVAAQVPAFDLALACGGTKTASQSRVSKAKTDKQGNVYVAGNFQGTLTLGNTTLTAADNDVFVAKLDAQGNYLWATQAGSSSTDLVSDLALDAQGNVHVTGYTEGGNPRFGNLSLFDPAAPHYAGDALFVATLSPGGAWLRAVPAGGEPSGSGTFVVGLALAVDAQGDAYVTGGLRGYQTAFGSFRLTNEGAYNTFVACLAANGTWRWAVVAGGNGYDFGQGIAADNRGGVYLTGTYDSYVLKLGSLTLPRVGFAQDAFVAKLDAGTGAWQWAVRAGSSVASDAGNAIAADGDRGEVYVTGRLGGGTAAAVGNRPLPKPAADPDVFVAKFDGATGACRWAVRGGGTGADAGTDVALGADGAVFVAGAFAGSDAAFGPFRFAAEGASDALVAALDAADGAWRWALASSGPGDNYATAVAPAASQRDVYVAGTFEGSTAAFGETIVHNGLSSNKNFTNRGFVARATDLARRSPEAELTLWPNPGRRNAPVWASGLPEGQPAQVFDQIGRLVVADARPAHQHQGLVLPASLAEGVYTVRCGQQARRLVLLD